MSVSDSSPATGCDTSDSTRDPRIAKTYQYGEDGQVGDIYNALGCGDSHQERERREPADVCSPHRGRYQKRMTQESVYFREPTTTTKRIRSNNERRNERSTRKPLGLHREIAEMKRACVPTRKRRTGARCEEGALLSSAQRRPPAPHLLAMDRPRRRLLSNVSLPLPACDALPCQAGVLISSKMERPCAGPCLARSAGLLPPLPAAASWSKTRRRTPAS